MDVGEKMKDFELEDKDGVMHKLSDIDSKYVVLYFYPKDNTSGCTLEAQEFSRDKKEFDTLGVTIIGISGGDNKSKSKFCEKHNLSILLLSDPEFETAKGCGVYGKKKFMGREYMGIFRVTFVLDKDKSVLKKFDSVKPLGHSTEVLEFIKGLD